MKKNFRVLMAVVMAAAMLVTLAGGGAAVYTDDEPEILTLDISPRIQCLVYGYAANIPVTAGVSPSAAGLDVYVALYSGERLISDEVKVSDGAAVIRIGRLEDTDGVYVGARFAGAEVSKTLGINVVSPSASVWEPVCYADAESGEMTVFFSEKIAPSGAYAVKIGDAAQRVAGSNDYSITIAAPAAQADGPVVISNVKYPGLFPSYKFTFTVIARFGAPEFISASGPADVYTGQSFAVTAATGSGVADVGLYDASGTRLTATSVCSDVDGVRTWALTLALSEPGDYELAVRYADAFGNWFDSGVVMPVSATDENAHPTVSRTLPSRASVHDPSIVKDISSDYYYIIGSGTGMARSADLSGWSSAGSINLGTRTVNFAESFAWAGIDGTNGSSGGTLYASDIVWNPYYDNGDGTFGAYMYYYCVSSNFKRGAIGFAVSQSSVTGLYEHRATIQYSGFTLTGGPDEQSATVDTIWTNTNLKKLIDDGVISGLKDEWFTEDGGYNSVEYPEDIDPTAFFDKDGRFWMIYGAHNGGLFLLELDKATGMPIYPGVDGVTGGGNQIDRYFGIRVAGGYYRGGEGGYIEYDPTTDYYYLITAYGQITAGYNLRLFRSRDVTGPYLDAAGNNAAFSSGADVTERVGIKLIGNYKFSTLNSSVTGGGYKYAGHGSLLAEAGQMYIFYHQRFASGSSHQIRTHQMFQNEDGWPVTAVFENTGDQISPTGYAMDEILGTYEFIDHGSQTSTAMLDTLIIELNADGTVTGDIEGIWGMTEGTYYMSMTVNGVDYKGVFFKQQDESNAVSKVTTFSAVGSNNECVWGARLALSDSDLKAVQAASTALTLPYNALTNASANPATTDIPLLNEWIYGTKIVWTTSEPAVISADGKVTRGAENVTVSLTATVIRGNAVTTKTFSVIVKAATEDAEAFTLPPLYNYGFSTADGYLTMNTGSLVGIGTLVGGAKVVTDEYKGPVLKNTASEGAENYLKLPNDTLKGIPNGLTVSMWVNPDADFDDMLFCAESIDGSGFGISGETYEYHNKPLVANEWNFVTLTISKTELALYLNGNLVYSGNHPDDPYYPKFFSNSWLANLDIWVGSGTWSGNNGTVKIDDVKIYGIPLNAGQVNSLIDPDVAWQTKWMIDFGPEGSPVAGGFIAMTNNAVYKKLPLIQCFGFETAPYAHETAEGGDKFRDFVYMPGGRKYTFYMDLPNGTYNVYVYTGAKDSDNMTNFTIQDDPTVYTHITPLGVGSDNHAPLAALRNFTVVVTDQLLKMTFWGDETLGPDAMTGRLGSLEITRIS